MDNNQNQQSQVYDQSDEIDFSRIFLTLWKYRVLIVIAFLSSLFLFVLFFAINQLYTTNKVATVQFQLQFRGAEKGEYPNGLKFDSGDLLTMPVLSAVYEKNNLAEYMDFSEFRNSLYVLRFETIEMLSKMEEFQERLTDRRLAQNPMERERVRREYEDFKKSITPTDYSLNFVLKKQIPAQLVYKTLSDVLSEWAFDVNYRLNVLKYRRPIYSENIIDDELIEKEDYIIAIDILQQKCEQIIENAKTIMGIPGGDIVRSGENDMSIPEIIDQVNNLIDYKLEPLSGLMREVGMSKDKNLTKIFLQSKLNTLQLEADTIDRKTKIFSENIEKLTEQRTARTDDAGVVTEAFQQGVQPGMPAMFSAPFIERMVNMATNEQEIQYRQSLMSKQIDHQLNFSNIDRNINYYLRIIQDFTSDKHKEIMLTESSIDNMENYLVASFNAVIEEMKNAIKNLNALYNTLSEENLNPRKGLYGITFPPAIKVERMFSRKNVLLIGFVFIGLVMVSTVIGCLINNSVREKRRKTSQ